MHLIIQWACGEILFKYYQSKKNYVWGCLNRLEVCLKGDPTHQHMEAWEWHEWKCLWDKMGSGGSKPGDNSLLYLSNHCFGVVFIS